MLAKLKKTGSSSHKDGTLAWRVDFRNVELLPDTKTVRTNFLVSAIVFTILGALIIFATHREVTLASMKEEIASIQAQISTTAAPNTAAEAQYKIFQAEEKKLKDVQAWTLTRFSFPDYLIHLASLMPTGVKANRIEFRGEGQSILVMGSIDGQDAAASETASNFIKTLQEDEKFKSFFSSVSNSNLSRSSAANTLSFELVFTFAKPTVKK